MTTTTHATSQRRKRNIVFQLENSPCQIFVIAPFFGPLSCLGVFDLFYN
jgi:hypothetical protein